MIHFRLLLQGKKKKKSSLWKLLDADLCLFSLRAVKPKASLPTIKLEHGEAAFIPQEQQPRLLTAKPAQEKMSPANSMTWCRLNPTLKNGISEKKNVRHPQRMSGVCESFVMNKVSAACMNERRCCVTSEKHECGRTSSIKNGDSLSKWFLVWWHNSHSVLLAELLYCV